MFLNKIISNTLFIAIAIFITLFTVSNTVVAYKTWDEIETCDRQTILTYFYRACVTYKRSASFFQPAARLSELNIKSEESEELDETAIMLPFIGRSQQQRRIRKLSEDGTRQIFITKVDATGEIVKVRNKMVRAARNAVFIDYLTTKCCEDEGCNIEDFIRVEEVWKYCDTS